MLRKISFLLFLLLPTSAFAQVLVIGGGPAGTSTGGGGTTITGGTCTNQFVKALNTAGVPTCVTITSLDVNTSVAITGVDINTASQVTATHLASPLPQAQGGLGSVVPGALNNVLQSNGTVWISGPVSGNVTGGTCTNQVATAISTSGVPTCTTVTPAMVTTGIAKTGTDMNTSNQVTVTHLASALPANQGGTASVNFTVLGPTAPRNYTFADANVTVVDTSSTQSLAGKTLSAPIIADLTNMQHPHSGASSGGNISGTAFPNQIANCVFASPDGSSGTMACRKANNLDLSSITPEIAQVNSASLSGFGGTYALSCTSPPCTLTLPSVSGHNNDTMAFAVIGGSSPWTITAAGTDKIDNKTSRILQAYETANLLTRADGWHKVSGLSIPFVCQLTNSSTQTITAATVTTVNLDTVSIDTSGLMASGTNHRCTTVRPGLYTTTGQVGWNNLAADGDYLGFAGRNCMGIPCTTRLTGQSEMWQQMNALGVYPKSNFVSTDTFSAAETVELGARGSQTDDIEAGHSVITMVEVITW